MRKTSLFINIALFIAVVVLYVMHFAANFKKKEADIESASNLPIAYVNTDSILLNYELSHKLHEEFTKVQESFSNEYERERTEWEDRANIFQDKINNGGFTSQEQAVKERDQLAEEQKKLVALDNNLSEQLTELQAENSNQLIDSIMSAIKRYNQEANFSFVLNSSGVIVGEHSNNITKDVLDMLNKEYDETTN